MKKIISYIPEWILLPIFGVIFILTWPLIIVWSGIQALFSKDSSDADKIFGAKSALFTIAGILILILYLIFEYPIQSFFTQFWF